MKTFSFLFTSIFLILSYVDATVILTPGAAEQRTEYSPRGANFSPCVDQSQCLPNRQCLALVSVTAPERCTSGKYCACVPRGEGSWRCSADGSCDEHETCMPMPEIFPPDRVCVDNSQIETVRDLLYCDDESVCEPSGRTCVVLEDGLGFCAAPLPSASDQIVDNEEPDMGPSAEEELEENGSSDATAAEEAPSSTACIAAHHLDAHRKQNALLYSNDVNAYVLCDPDNNCATDGHMVLFEGRAMMMKSYCMNVRCERMLMKVNSLRWSRAATVASHREGLVFTAFSARFATRVEEAALTAVMRLGF
ncbi:hypothetical protein FGB62_172g02 [Gracilaria domingensis]|nr:hypothetical protein FGB62_172g02 [Gracilaria domingensis]